MSYALRRVWKNRLCNQKPRWPQSSGRLFLEALEDRWVPSSFQVTSTADDGSMGTLRWAINQSNSSGPGPNQITFDIDGGGAQTIGLLTALPTITVPVTIDGTTQPGASGSPPVTVDANSSPLLWIFNVTAGGCTIEGLNLIDNPGGDAILLQTGGGNSVLGNVFANDGTAVSVAAGSSNNVIGATTAPFGNQVHSGVQIGVQLSGSGVTGNKVQTSGILASVGVDILAGAHDNTIGGSSKLAGNAISSVVIANGSNHNTISGNNIGISILETGFGNAGDGLTIASGSSNNQVMSNAISFNGGNGINITDPGTTGNVIENNLIGTDLTGENAAPNQQAGIIIQNGASGNQIGAQGSGNTISGNGSDGVLITGNGTTGNLVQGNFIGTDVSGSTKLANSGAGVRIANGASGNTIGGYSFVDPGTQHLNGAGNVISANLNAGVEVVQSSGNFVQGNFIGTDAAGKKALPNDPIDNLFDGVDLFNGSSNNTIGGFGFIDSNGTLQGTGNLLSGNAFDGVALVNETPTAGPLTGNVIEGNFIGVDVTGEKGLPNAGNGVHLARGASQNTVGGTGTFRNVISDNGIATAQSAFPVIGAGVQIEGYLGFGPVQGNTVEGNIIGLDVAGTKALGNLNNGITLQHGVTGNQIGFAGAGNIISGNSNGQGVYVTDAGTDGNLLQGNFIGTDISGTQKLGNSHGVEVANGATNTLIGGGSEGNVISGNSHSGIFITTVTTTGTTVQGNFIGVDVSGRNPLGNGSSGIAVDSAPHETLIGTDGTGFGDAEKRNIIAANGNDGITIQFAFDTTVAGNYIGTDVTGTVPLPNADSGVYVFFAQHNRIGTNADGVDDAAEGNIISSNSQSGVTLDGDNTTDNTVAGNYIGTDPSHTLPLGNTIAGVRIINGANGNTIGGANPVAGNLIVNNSKGIFVGASPTDSTTVDNAILSNRIFGNAGLGIDLGNDGVTPNSPNSPHVGPNDLTSFPVIALAGASGTNTFLQVKLSAVPNTNYTIQIFTNPAADPSGFGQGMNLMATLDNVTTDGLGNATINTSIATNLLGSFLSATATDAAGNTSELGPDTQVSTLAPAVFGKGFFATEQGLYTGVVASFVDPSSASAGCYTALVTWGDGSSSQGTVQASGGGFLVVASHTYTEEGVYATTTTVTDAPGSTGLGTALISVADAALTAIPRTANFTEATFANQVVASFQDANPSAFAGQFTASINWGDGVTSNGTIVADGAGFDVSGTHAYAIKGSYPVTVTIGDKGGSIVANSTAVVSPPPLIGIPRSFSVFNNLNFFGRVASFIDPDPRTNSAGYQATIYWPDNSTTSVVTPNGGNPFNIIGQHVFSAFPGTLTLKVVVVDLQIPGRSVTILSRVADPPAPEMNQIYVMQLYTDLLQRPADDGGLAYWTGLLDHGTSRQQVAADIVASPEYKTLEVRHLYQTLLHRDADAGGLQTFVALLLSGGTVEQAQAMIVASPEYFQVRGGGTNAGFLAALYQDALNRAPDPTGQAAFGGELAQGVSRLQVASAIFASAEYASDLVASDYQAFLHRSADVTGLAAFTQLWRQGMRDEGVIAAIVASDEYFAGLSIQ